MTKALTPQWQRWIEARLQRGHDKNDIVSTLLKQGFSREQIDAAMTTETFAAENRTKEAPARRVMTIRRRDTGSGVGGSDDSAERSRLSRQKIFLPNALQLVTDKAEIYLLDDFLNREECEGLVSRIKSRMRASEIAAAYDEDADFRTSSTCDLGFMGDPLVEDIDDRICRMIGINPSHSEILQGQHYDVGQEFKAHTDYFEVNQIGQYGGDQGQRTYTFFIYLNNVEEGGETEFPELDLSIKPRLGRAVVWNNLTTEGLPNAKVLHRAWPVIRGEKCVITKWFRAKGAGSMFTKEPNEFNPVYTQEGFKKSRLAPDLFREIADFYRDNSDRTTTEVVEGGYVYTQEPGGVGSSLVNLSTGLRARIHDALLGELSEWSGVDLSPTHLYGIRNYHRGAVLKPHRDRLKTHIISAIINVDQDTQRPWPLIIEDNNYRAHRVYLEPGEVVFYEGSRLLHGRPEPLDGEHFANIFCHYMPA